MVELDRQAGRERGGERVFDGIDRSGWNVGRFENGVGKFYVEDNFKGKPIRVRYLWTKTSGIPHWEQAFSIDGGATWETNWVMDFRRIP